MPKLRNRRRERFAIEVAAMTPLDRAYVAAGYADTPWSRYNASKLANLPEVSERIEELRAEFKERSQIHAEYIQRKLLPLVEANAADLFEPQADLFEGRERLKSITALPRDLAAAVSKIKCDPETGRVTEISLHSKIEAGNVLLRSVGGVVDRHEFSGKNGGPLTLEMLVGASFQQELPLVDVTPQSDDDQRAAANRKFDELMKEFPK